MAFDEKLAVRIRKRIGNQKGLVEKQMFGGIAFLLHGNMCVDRASRRRSHRSSAPGETHPHFRPVGRPHDEGLDPRAAQRTRDRRRAGEVGDDRGRVRGFAARQEARVEKGLTNPGREPGVHRATFFTVSHVRVVCSLPKVFCSSVMKTGPLGVRV